MNKFRKIFKNAFFQPSTTKRKRAFQKDPGKYFQSNKSHYSDNIYIENLDQPQFVFHYSFQKCYEQKQYKNGLKFAKQILSNPKFQEHGGK